MEPSQPTVLVRERAKGWSKCKACAAHRTLRFRRWNPRRPIADLFLASCVPCRFRRRGGRFHRKGWWRRRWELVWLWRKLGRFLHGTLDLGVCGLPVLGWPGRLLEEGKLEIARHEPAGCGHSGGFHAAAIQEPCPGFEDADCDRRHLDSPDGPPVPEQSQLCACGSGDGRFVVDDAWLRQRPVNEGKEARPVLVFTTYKRCILASLPSLSLARDILTSGRSVESDRTRPLQDDVQVHYGAPSNRHHQSFISFLRFA